MIKIRPAVKTDVPAIHRLVQELAEFEKAPQEMINTVEQMAIDGFGDKPLFEVFIAELEGKVIGMALFFTIYSTWKGKCIYLDDLIVDNEYRRSGAGTLLFEELIRYSKKQGANQLRWHVLDWNEPAIKFYKKYNSNLDPTWVTGKLSREQILKFEI